jgi:hypothetical protein
VRSGPAIGSTYGLPMNATTAAHLLGLQHPTVSYGRTGVVRGSDANRALPYAMRRLHTREWRA